MKVLFICKKRIASYGSTTGLVNSARFVSKFLNEIGVESKVIEVVDANSIDWEVMKYNPDQVILEALWVTPAKIKELLSYKAHAQRDWIIRIHSKIPFLSQEGIALQWIGEYVDIAIDNPEYSLRIAPNTKELTDQFNMIYKTEALFITLNNLYPIPDKQGIISPEVKENIHIGCFGAIRPLKNQLLQAIAAIEFADKIGKKLYFHVNGERVEHQGDAAIKNIRSLFKSTHHELVEHGWYDHEQFLEIISIMDLGMQVSLSESYNIVTADFVVKGVPIVVSNDISWMPFFLRAVPTNYKDIVAKLETAYRYKNCVSRSSFRALKKYNEEAKKTCL